MEFHSSISMEKVDIQASIQNTTTATFNLFVAQETDLTETKSSKPTTWASDKLTVFNIRSNAKLLS